MKIVIPAKAGSIRVPNKNFREFSNGKSLLDITLQKVLAVVSREDVYVSCEDESKRGQIENWGVNFIRRDVELCENDAPFHEWFNRTIEAVPGDDDIAWCQVIDPLFDEYAECFATWKTVRENHDSIVVVYPLRKYLLSPSFEPIGFGFGKSHVKSQMLPTHYELTFTLSVLKRSAIRCDGYHVGQNPYWYKCASAHIDIDTLEEYELAGQLYERRFRA